MGTFDERNRLESGQFIGPRIFQTGQPIYGAGSDTIHHDIADDAEAYSALVRIKVEGGPASFSYKNYNLPSRYVLMALSSVLRIFGTHAALQCISSKSAPGREEFEYDQRG